MTRTTIARRMQFASRSAVSGVSGNTPSLGGAMNTGEYLRKLDGQTGRMVFDQMRRSDGQVGAVLKAISLPLRSNEYRIEPASDDAKDREIAERLELRLKNEMTVTWDDTLRHALLMLPFGFSILEKVWERAEDGLIMPKKLDPRLPMSIVRWSFASDGSLVGPVQRDTNGREYTLPIEKLLVFTTDREGDNWEGISILRQAYKAWYIKDQLEKVNAIKHDRFGVGVPVGTVPAGLTEDSPQYQNTVAMLERFYANEQSYIVQPEGYGFNILGISTEKSGTDALPSIKYYDEMIAKSMLAMFINLGTTDTGSRALGSTFFDAFMLSLQAFAAYITDVINRYLIREWVNYNWAVVEYPRMKAAQIKNLDYTQIAQLIGVRAINPDAGLENAIRRSMNLPEREEIKVDEVARPTAAEEDEPATDDDQDHEPPAEPVVASERVILTREEGYVDIQGITMRLNSAERSLTSELQNIRDEQAKNLAMQLVAGRPIHNITVVARGDMFNALLAVFNAQKKAGRQDVLDEAKKQRPDLKFGDLVRPLARQRSDLAVERINLDVDAAASKLRSMMAQWTLDLKQSGLQGDDLRVALLSRYSDMPTSTWDEMATGAVNRGWGAGRDAGIETLGDGIDYCYYSAIMDSALCDACRSTSQEPGADHHSPDDPTFATPNPDCLGGGRCRCMTIAVMKAESARSA